VPSACEEGGIGKVNMKMTEALEEEKKGGLDVQQKRVFGKGHGMLPKN